MAGYSQVEIRSLNYEDLEAVIEIDRKVTGQAKPEYWAKKFDAYLSNPETTVAAVIQGQIAGFIMADSKGGEFGSNDGTGWIELLGVVPDCNNQGIGTALYNYLEEYFRNAGVTKVFTMVASHNSTGILGFFHSLGFMEADFIVIEKNI